MLTIDDRVFLAKTKFTSTLLKIIELESCFFKIFKTYETPFRIPKR